jgi:two-component system phosphate regulon sensor histidine kinase PhoR
MGVEAELKSLFSNLIINAVKYTPKGGSIDITWGLEKGRPVFSVKDTGIGIAKKHLPRITERFYRVDKARSRESGGTGLGLAIVKHVLVRHEAQLEIESQLHHGSTFTCIFPTSRAV